MHKEVLKIIENRAIAKRKSWTRPCLARSSTVSQLNFIFRELETEYPEEYKLFMIHFT